MVKIAGVVVLYFPDFQKLAQNISTYISQVDRLWVICNSKVDDESIKSLCERFPKIEVTTNHKNLGIAKALNQAAKIAIDSGYNWLLTMDQDSNFGSEKFFQYFQEKASEQIAVFAPNADKQKSPQLDGDSSEEEVLSVITSGNLLNLKIWERLDGFNEKLFIDEVDHEYCLRAVSQGFKILQFRNVHLIHELGNDREVSFLFKRYKVITHSPTRTYYIFRNNFYVFNKFHHQFPDFVRERKIVLWKVFIKILLFSNNKASHLQSIYWGIKDYRNGRFGSLVVN